MAYFFDNLLHTDVRHNIEEKICCYICVKTFIFPMYNFKINISSSVSDRIVISLMKTFQCQMIWDWSNGKICIGHL